MSADTNAVGSAAGERKGEVRATRFAEPPTIDGRLEEDVWHQAAVLGDFFQTEPGDNVKPSHPTEVRIGYDTRFFYIGIRAIDQPGQVRSTVAKRDDLSGNDYVAVWLDTFNDKRRAYVLLFNPLGVQGDGVFTEGQGIDFSVDVVMQSRGRVTDDGYTVEVAVPFTSLRYEAGPGKCWGAHVLRIVRHLDEWDTWMPLRRESRDFRTATFTQFLEQAGHITGIENVGRGRTLELIPTLAFFETGRRVPAPGNAERFVNQPMNVDLGLTAKLSLSSGTNPWDLNVTYNSVPRENSRLISWSVTSSTRAQFTWQARMQYAFQALRTQFNFKKQTYLKADAYTDYQRLFEEEYGPKRTAIRRGAFVAGPERSTVWKGYTLEVGTSPSKKYTAVVTLDQSWNSFDYDLGTEPRFPRVSPPALADPLAPFDPGKGNTVDLNVSLAWQPSDALRVSLNQVRSRLFRLDTQRVAYDQQLHSLKTTYQFTRFTFARARVDYDTLRANLSGQFLMGWTPNPGTAFYAGYNDDLNHNGFNPFTGAYEPGLHRNARTFFIKASYLFRFSV